MNGISKLKVFLLGALGVAMGVCLLFNFANIWIFGKYYIYEQASSTSLDPTGKTLVEEGKYLVTTTLPTEYSHTQTINEYVYNG